MKELFDTSSYQCSKLITNAYSTSFSMGIKLFSPVIRPAIYAIYGFVRYADEIVDTFDGYQQEELLNEFEADYYKSLERGISLNPILNSFQEVVLKYELQSFVTDFMKSMRDDLSKKEYATTEEYQQYIYGSADVVGLMCLKVFVNNDKEKFERLKGPAMKLGSAFQKVNFLRDLKDDVNELGRSYFPEMDTSDLDEQTKKVIIEDIEKDFADAREGILQLPMESKFGVFLAYKYYLSLLMKLKRMNSHQIMSRRIRISNGYKAYILMKAFLRFKLNIL